MFVYCVLNAITQYFIVCCQFNAITEYLVVSQLNAITEYLIVCCQLNAITEYFMAKRKAMEAQARALEAGLNIKPKYEYDSDEDTEGGTWEHKRRVLEMTATQGQSLLTSPRAVRGHKRWGLEITATQGQSVQKSK